MKCQVKKLSPFRLLSIYAYEALGTGHNMYAQIEFDVTGIRQKLRALREEGQNVTLYGFLLSAIAKSIDENRELNHVRRGKKIYCFDEVDISTAIEASQGGAPIPRIYIVRDAARKTMAEISEEIENAKRSLKETGSIGKEDQWGKRWLKLTSILPKWLIQLVIRQIGNNPQQMKEQFGTTYVASVGGFADVPGFIVPFFEGQNRPMAFAVGNVVKKPGVVGADIKIREYLSMTISFNHDLVDGAPAARFVSRLKHRIEKFRAD